MWDEVDWIETVIGSLLSKYIIGPGIGIVGWTDRQNQEFRFGKVDRLGSVIHTCFEKSQ